MSDQQPRTTPVHDAGFEPVAPETPAGPVIPVPPTDPERKRSAAEIKADNERLRAEMTATVDELADRVDPRAHVAAAKERASDAASEVAEVAKVKAAQAQEVGTAFVEDVKRRDPKALAVVAGAVTAVAAVVAISVSRK